MDEKSLISSIAEIVRTTWNDQQQPLLISNIPRHLAETDFRSVLGKEGLKSFVTRTCAEGGYEIVRDALHKERVGAIPAGEAYEFPATAPQTLTGDKRKGETLLKFLDLLADLSEEDQRSVVIPVNVIAKLLQK